MDALNLITQTIRPICRQLSELLCWFGAYASSDPISIEDIDAIAKLAKEWQKKHQVPAEVLVAALATTLHNLTIAIPLLEEEIDGIRRPKPSNN
jgi:hypothetical protein